MAEPFLGQISFFGFNFAPLNWAQCQGQLMPITQNTALFSLLGTQFGGDGIRTFGLPDLRGRVAVGQGQGPGLQDYSVGEIGGEETVVLTAGTIPSHTHGLPAATASGNTSAPSTGTVLAGGHAGQHQSGYNIDIYAPVATGAATTLAPNALVGAAGGPGAHTNLQPTLTGNWCIALSGLFPSRG